MPTKIKIKVTKEILKQSAFCGTGPAPEGKVHESFTNCAFSLAIRDIFPDAIVGSSKIIPFPNKDEIAQLIEDFADMDWNAAVDKGHAFPISSEMSQFIEMFDDSSPRERVEEIPEEEFELELPDWVISKIDISDITKSLTLELVA